MLTALCLVFFADSFGVAGHILFKQSTNRVTVPGSVSWVSHLAYAAGMLKFPGIWLGLLSMALGLVVWLIALSRFDLSFVFPVGSMHYVLTLIASRIFLKEKIDATKLFGTFLVIVGIVIISLN